VSLWDRLFTGAKPPTVDHHVFGKITFMRLKLPGRSYWEADAVFRPTSTSIHVLLDGDEAGPSDDDDHTFTILMNGWAPAAEARIDG
jgi:hypothetical protein